MDMIVLMMTMNCAHTDRKYLSSIMINKKIPIRIHNITSPPKNPWDISNQVISKLCQVGVLGLSSCDLVILFLDNDLSFICEIP